MIESAHGIILRKRPLTETSLIIHWLTPALGRVHTVAKGARRSKSPFAGRLDLFYAADFSFNRSRRSELHVLREVSLREPHRALREDIFKLRQAGYAVAFIEEATEIESPLPGIFTLFGGFLKFLCERPAAPHSIFALELKLLRELGLAPDLAEARLTPGAKKIAETLAQSGWPGVAQLKLSATQTAELRQFLHGFLIFHLGKLPRGRAASLAPA